MKKLIVAMGMTAVLLMLPLYGSATPTLVLDSSFTPGVDVFITDGGLGDSNPLVGVITFTGPLSGFEVNVTTGITKPVFPADASHMDLNSVNVSAAGGGVLNIYFGETGFFSPISGEFRVGGTLNGSPGSKVSFSSYFDNTNANLNNVIPILPATATLLGTLGNFNPGAYSGTMGIQGASDDEYSLFLAASIDFKSGAGNVSFDEEMQGKVPEPMSLILLGSGLAGLGIVRRLRRK